MHYSHLTLNFQNELLSLTDTSDSILITSQKCDDDGIAAVLAMYTILRDRYPKKKLKIVVLHYENHRWSRLKNFQEIEFIDDFKKYAPHFKLIIFLDYSRLSYWNLTPKDPLLDHAKTICIDHHSNTPDDFTLSLVVPEATSSSELILQTFYSEKPLNSDLAQIFLTGILGDTGILKYITPANAKVYSLIEKIITEQSIDLGAFISALKQCSRKQFRLIQEFIRTTRIETTDNWPAYSIAFIDQKFKDQGKVEDLDLDEASGYYVSQFGTFIDETEWGMVLYPQSDGTVRIKVRSQTPRINVRSIMESLGIGGGHARAGGGVFLADSSAPKDTPECVGLLKQWLLSHRYDRVLEKCEDAASEQRS